MTASPWSIIVATVGASCGAGIRNPDEAASPVAVREDLRRCVVMGHLPADHRPGETTSGVVEIDDELARDEAVAERHDARAIFEPDICDESGREPQVERSDVPKRIPRPRPARLR